MADELPLTALNAAKAQAFSHCEAAVALLAKVMADPEYDMEQRIMCAAELLQFAAKGPY